MNEAPGDGNPLPGDPEPLPGDPAPPPGDGAPVSQLALRDGAIVLGALALWAAADASHAASGLGLAAWPAVLVGMVAGSMLGVRAHEWGHFAGARWAGGTAPTAAITSLFPIFHFDIERSEPRAFLVMSVAGNAADWLLVAALAIALPLDTPGRVALLAGAFSFAVGVSLSEFPVIERAMGGASPLESSAAFDPAKVRRNRWIGIGAGLWLFAVL